MPCQWIEVGTVSRFVTRSVTVSPSRQRRIGPGIWPLTRVAVVGLPVILTRVGSTERSNWVPESSGKPCAPLKAAARARGAENGGRSAAIAVPAANPSTKRRRVREVDWPGRMRGETFTEDEVLSIALNSNGGLWRGIRQQPVERQYALPQHGVPAGAVRDSWSGSDDRRSQPLAYGSGRELMSQLRQDRRRGNW